MRWTLILLLNYCDELCKSVSTQSSSLSQSRHQLSLVLVWKGDPYAIPTTIVYMHYFPRTDHFLFVISTSNQQSGHGNNLTQAQWQAEIHPYQTPGASSKPMKSPRSHTGYLAPSVWEKAYIWRAWSFWHNPPSIQSALLRGSSGSHARLCHGIKGWVEPGFFGIRLASPASLRRTRGGFV